MSEMTGIERIVRQLRHQSVDRIGCHEHFWAHTQRRWEESGLEPDYDFGFDIGESWAFKLALNPDVADRILADDGETQTFVDCNGATMRRHLQHDSTPEHLGYAINDRSDWEEKAKPLLTPELRRINFDAYTAEKTKCAAKNRFFCWSGVNVFESIHPITGHENLLMGMALDPDWILDMTETYADLWIALMEELFARAGKPDGVWFFEDMGFKERPFMSPEMYRELIYPAHKRTCDFAHSHGLPVFMHSCGFVEPLLPGMIDAGIDCLQAIEVKAGMDLLRIDRNFGDRIALMGGLDVRPVAANDLAGIDRELEAKLPLLKKHNGFIFHSDHSIPESTTLATYRYFLERGRELGKY